MADHPPTGSGSGQIVDYARHQHLYAIGQEVWSSMYDEGKRGTVTHHLTWGGKSTEYNLRFADGTVATRKEAYLHPLETTADLEAWLAAP